MHALRCLEGRLMRRSLIGWNWIDKWLSQICIEKVMNFNLFFFFKWMCVMELLLNAHLTGGKTTPQIDARKEWVWKTWREKEEYRGKRKSYWRFSFWSRLSGLEASVPKHSQMKPIYTKQVGAWMTLTDYIDIFHSNEHQELLTFKEHQRNSLEQLKIMCRVQ